MGKFHTIAATVFAGIGLLLMPVRADDANGLFPDANVRTPPASPAPPAPSQPPVSTSAPAPAAVKLPVPAAAAVAAALKVVNDAFADDITAARTPDQKSAVVQKLLSAAHDEKDPASRFALLSRARDVAIDSGDVDKAFSAIDGIIAAFNVDALKMKSEAASAIMRAVHAQSQRDALAGRLPAIIDEAIAADRYDIALAIAQLAVDCAYSGGDEALREATVQLRQVRGAQAAYIAIKPALAVLAANPADKDANLTVGKFRCFIKGDWAGGLPMLALGNDAELGGLAAKDLAGPTTPDAQAELGDGWWGVAEKQPDAAKRQIRLRAAMWYTQAAPNLSGLAKARVEERIKALAAEEPAKPIDLLKLIDTTKDSVAGTWILGNGMLGTQGASVGRLEIPYTPPAEYDLTIVFAEGSNAGLAVICYAAGHQFNVDIGGYENKICGIEAVNGQKTALNPTANRAPAWLVQGQKYTCTIKVRKNGVAAYLNGTVVTQWKTDFSDMSLLFYTLNHGNTLGVGGWNTPLIIYSMKITEITGKGSPLPGRGLPAGN